MGLMQVFTESSRDANMICRFAHSLSTLVGDCCVYICSQILGGRGLSSSRGGNIAVVPLCSFVPMSPR